MYKLSESERQEPGVIKEHVFTSLASSVEELPRKAKYPKKMEQWERQGACGWTPGD